MISLTPSSAWDVLGFCVPGCFDESSTELALSLEEEC
jgi:hypothetical protein